MRFAVVRKLVAANEITLGIGAHYQSRSCSWETGRGEIAVDDDDAAILQRFDFGEDVVVIEKIFPVFTRPQEFAEDVALVVDIDRLGETGAGNFEETELTVAEKKSLVLINARCARVIKAGDISVAIYSLWSGLD